MSIRVGINGFGRMGKLGLRAGWDHPELNIVHINEIKGDAACHAHLLEFDSVHRRWSHEIAAHGDSVIAIGGKRVGWSGLATPEEVDWSAKGIDLLIECSGRFKTEEALAPYFAQGVRKVLVSAPVAGAGTQCGLRHQRPALRPRAAPHRHRRLLYHQLSGSRGQGGA